MSDIAKYIKCLMEEANVSAVELMKAAPVSRPTLSKILRGRSRGSITTLNRILAVFDCYVTVRRSRNQPSDIDKESGKLRLPFDDPIENNPMLDKLRNRRAKTQRPR